MKRFFDLFVVLITLPLWLTVSIVVALFVLVALGSPIFFKQERAGLKGKSFWIVKFRTMLDGGGTDEERLTRFGRFLRATSLDELPELWNVLRGEMSLVGPRPLPIRYLGRYTREQMRRHDVLPGITGWAQINGRNSLDWDMKFKFDLDYVARQSLLFDLKILILTIVRVINPSGISHEGEVTMGEFLGTQDKSDSSLV